MKIKDGDGMKFMVLVGFIAVNAYWAFDWIILGHQENITWFAFAGVILMGEYCYSKLKKLTVPERRR